MRAKILLVLGLLAGVGFVGVNIAGCHTTGECNNGVCECQGGDSCDFTCGASPCHARCKGDNDSCNAVCANGTCSCGKGSTCNFTCKQSPCHVSCSTESTCAGTCQDGKCDCGVNSTCTFTCAGGPCHASCAAGAKCVVLCSVGVAGTQDCDIQQCAAGAPVICPGGKATTCGAPCP